jgi:N-acetylglutamate synthase-like GNAT family acetyltransferase
MTTKSTDPQNVSKNSEKIDISELQFVRLKIPRLIPIDLIESVKGRTFSPEQFYVYQENQIDNPNNHLYVVIDSKKKIHGYLWAEVNILDSSLFVNTFSIGKDFWGKGKGIDAAIQFISKLKDKIKASRVLWCTTNEKFFAKHGFKRSKITLMEYLS